MVFKTMSTDPDSTLVVDVRNPVERIPPRMPGSVWMPEEKIEARLDELPREKPIVLYCWDVWYGLTSSAAAPLLDAGYEVRELHGGVKAWPSLRQPVDDLGQ